MENDKYIEATKVEHNNIKHQIQVYNITKKNDITDSLLNTSLNISRSLVDNGAITPNNVTLSFSFDDWKQKEIDLFFNSKSTLTNKKFTEYNIRFDEFTKEVINSFPLNKGDLIKMTDRLNTADPVNLFVGIVHELRLQEDFNNNKTIFVTLKDMTQLGYNMYFKDDVAYKDYYYYNSEHKDTSILYLLAKKLGFEDSDILIEEMRYSEDDNKVYLKIPFINIKKGTKVIELLVMLVQSVAGNIYVNRDGKLKITSVLDTSDVRKLDYTLNESNIIDSFEVYEEVANYNKLEIKYYETVQEARQPVFTLYGKNADYKNDDAKIDIKANEPKSNTYWNLTYITPEVIIEGNDKTPVIKAYKYEDNKRVSINDFTDYEIDYDKKRLKIWNSRDYTIYIEQFKIFGKPIQTYNNTVTYTEQYLEDAEVKLLTINNKYIVTTEQAKQVARLKYHQRCKNKKRFNITINSLPILELEDVVKLKFRGFDTQLQIIAINQLHNKTQLQCIEYQDYVQTTRYTETFQENAYNNKVINAGLTSSNKELTIVNDDKTKKIVFENGNVLIHELDVQNNIWRKSNLTPKRNEGYYTFNPDTPEKERWIDVRNNESEEWKNVDIKASIKSVPITSDTKQLVCDVVKHPTDKHKFYVAVGSSNLSQKAQTNSNEIHIDEEILRINKDNYTDNLETVKEYTLKGIKNFSVSFKPNVIDEYETKIIFKETSQFQRCEFLIRLCFEVIVEFKIEGENEWHQFMNENNIEFDNPKDIKLKVATKILKEYSNLSIYLSGMIDGKTKATTFSNEINHDIDWGIPIKIGVQGDKASLINLLIDEQEVQNIIIEPTLEDARIKIDVQNKPLNQEIKGGTALWIATEK